MRIGVPLGKDPDRPLVATTPETARKLHKLGYDVVVERGAGRYANFLDEQYAEAGATLVGSEEAWATDIVLCVDAPEIAQLDLMEHGATLISRMSPGTQPQLLDELAKRGITGLAMDMVPRISRAQSLDVLSSMANLAGYRAVIEAASHFGRLFHGQVTAAGKVPPATVYVIGAGVAGLAAIGTAHSLGAVVQATDVRSEVAEQIESMGAEFVGIPAQEQQSSDGYASELRGNAAQIAQQVYARQAAQADIVITTANIPGKQAPLLIDAAAVAQMKPGSIIVDLASANGGNCELTVPGSVTTTDNGVTIIGYTDYSAHLPTQASQLFSQNIVNFFALTTPEKDGQLHLDYDDVIIRQMTVTLEGRIMYPPPKVRVSASVPQAKPAESKPEVVAEQQAPAKAKSLGWKILAAVVVSALIFAAPPALSSHLMVFALACVVGFYVITAVTHSLHTPLMSVTNAISGIIVVGAVTQLADPHPLVLVFAFLAVVVASINIFGGFIVTDRMLKMFTRSEG